MSTVIDQDAIPVRFSAEHPTRTIVLTALATMKLVSRIQRCDAWVTYRRGIHPEASEWLGWGGTNMIRCSRCICALFFFLLPLTL